jgi:hypothetical protein
MFGEFVDPYNTLKVTKSVVRGQNKASSIALVQLSVAGWRSLALT